jgi:diamine N-acetyltransferase
MVPSVWQTERLMMRNAALDDVDRLREIFNANAHIGIWDATFQPVAREEIATLVHDSLAGCTRGTLPFQLQCICTQSTASGEAAGVRDSLIVGYYHMAYGPRRPDMIWISMFVMHPDAQQQRYGREALTGLCAQFDQLAVYTAVWAEVWLKNWPALRFWAGGGFDHIVEFRGDRVLTLESYASVILEHRLGKRVAVS